MSDAVFGAGSFTWLLGIEDTCVYPNDPAAATLDEYELTGHTTQWRTDLEQVRDLGATAVRYGVSWPLVHIGPDEFDWTVLDEVIPYAVDELGLAVVADLVHYGTPTWLTDSFADARYPDAIEAFAEAFAARYRSRVHAFTPLNEPVTTASFCGLRGVWPPARTGWDGWVSVAVPMALGIVKSSAAIRRVHNTASIVHVEAASLISADGDHLDDHARLLRMIGWLPTDLILGRVDEHHPAHSWLLDHGATAINLDWLLSHPLRPDVMGVNYYPDLTPRRLAHEAGAISQISHDRWTDGLRHVLAAFADRYQLPIVITETSIEGDDDLRVRWLEESARAVAELVNNGMDIRGYTWWPLFDFVDWSWAAGGANVEEFVIARVTHSGATIVAPAPPLGDPADGKAAFLRRMGLVRLDELPDGSLARTETAAAAEFRWITSGDTT